MSFTAEIPAANAPSANATLQAAGHGPNNFTVAIWTASVQPSFVSLLHLGNDAVFQAACAALPGCVVRSYGERVKGMNATATAAGGRWGNNAPLLQGSVTPGLYRATPADGGGLWMVVQSFNRTTFNMPLNTSTNPYPALLRPAREPGVVTTWVQPIDAFDAYKLVNPVTGLPDQVTHAGQTWRVSQADGSGNNVSVPGVSGWTVV